MRRLANKRALARGAAELATVALAWVADPLAAAPADIVLLNGKVYTVDAADTVAQAVALRGGRIAYVGSNEGARAWAGAKTRRIDLAGRFLMPGLVDGHMHPMAGGAVLRSCDLRYEALSIAQMQARIQACLDADKQAGDGKWLSVVNWYRQYMQPPGTDATHATLDALHTRRPIYVTSADYHSMLANARAMKLAGIAAGTADPAGGRIAHDGQGQPTGILEDDARNLILGRLPPPQPQDQLADARAALDALRRQGITSLLDAAPAPEGMAAFAELQRRGQLTARLSFAPVVAPEQAADPEAVIATLRKLARKYDQGAPTPAPGLRVHHAKIFDDGVLEAPALTAAMLAPYNVNRGSDEHPDWQPGSEAGKPYFAAPLLKKMLVALAQAGFDPHIHAIGDRAVRESLDACQALRDSLGQADIRPAIAHDESVDPADYARFRDLDVIPVMSYQWAKRGPDSIDNAQDYLGPERFARMEPEGSLYAAGARIAYGSDWPIDRLDEWFNLEVGVTREGDGSLGPKYDGPFNAEKGLPLSFVLRSVTMNSSYELHQDAQTGSIEPGKLADLIVLDRDPTAIAPAALRDVRVLLTMVGGRTVWQAPEFALHAPGR